MPFDAPVINTFLPRSSRSTSSPPLFDDALYYRPAGSPSEFWLQAARDRTASGRSCIRSARVPAPASCWRCRVAARGY
jgi:hypothetical protein